MKHVASGKPRGYLQILSAYQRMLRLEVEKQHATIESAADLDAGLQNEVVSDLRGKYGDDLTTEFRSNPDLIGGGVPGARVTAVPTLPLMFPQSSERSCGAVGPRAPS